MKIGIQELLVVFIVALIVVGPDKLPYYAKKLGEAFGQFRKYTEEATKDIRESVVEPLEEAQRPLREAMAPVTELEQSVRNNVNDLKTSINNIGKPGVEIKKEETASSAATDQSVAAAPVMPSESATSGPAEAALKSDGNIQKPAGTVSESDADRSSAEPDGFTPKQTDNTTQTAM